ncbi:8113_t:CDS:2 [Funneliformis mosseae]|uniref:8113_t:CDS:1 n=1 Tax=Funneliformis mosseae TaxID=27381 RepID=A0A9N9FNW2_FUNMO|nr:8113_t:CDS:2 [Funneliformis mosseae]
MKIPLISFLVVTLLTSLVVAIEPYCVMAPFKRQQVGTSVNVTWDASQIPKGLKANDMFSAIVVCRERTYASLEKKFFSLIDYVNEIFKVGIRAVYISDDPELIGATCKAKVSIQKVTGYSYPFRLHHCIMGFPNVLQHKK